MSATKKRVQRVWGPGALAVLSCALALLASQPVKGAGVPTSPVRVAVAGYGEKLDVLGGAIRTEVGLKERRGEGTRLLSSARRLHVLATFEILQRLLAFELRPVERQVAAELGIGALELCLFERVVEGMQGVGFEEGCGVSSERAFVMARCLLAPPTAV